MNMVYKALTTDIITGYAFGKSTNYVTCEDYNRAYFETFENIYEYAHWMFHIGWLGQLMESLPIQVTIRLIPEISFVFKLRLVNFSETDQ